jgi:hypothetical protein
MSKRLQTVTDHVTDIRISTASVDIQVMRIGTKQMTVAVFRQLPEKDIFDEWGYLLAPAWGWVNYVRDRYEPKSFVFSYQGILYRCKIDLEIYNRSKVNAEIHEKYDAYYHKTSVSTGKWIISYVDRWFASEDDARNYLANALISVAELKEAPQLFIGV